MASEWTASIKGFTRDTYKEAALAIRDANLASKKAVDNEVITAQWDAVLAAVDGLFAAFAMDGATFTLDLSGSDNEVNASYITIYLGRHLE